MIYIYDEYYSNPEFVQSKSAFGNLKNRWTNKSPYTFTDVVEQPTIFLIALDVYQDVEIEQVDRIVELYKKHRYNKILIDICIEDFVKESFYTLGKNLEDRGVDYNDIYVLGAQQFLGSFVDDFNIPYPVLGINRMETNYYDHAIFQQSRGKDLQLFREIQPRKLKKHFISYKKNPRWLRKLFHGYMTDKNYIDKSYYSWYGFGNHMMPEAIQTFQYFGMFTDLPNDRDVWADKIQELNQPVTSFGYDGVNMAEWSMEEDAVLHGGINLIHETHQTFDKRFPQDVKLLDTIAHTKLISSVFLTEKTFKNFCYGLPYLNPGVPRSEHVLKTIGYKSWDSMFETRPDNTSYLSCIKTYMLLLDEIANMSLQDLEDHLNSERSMDQLKHNKEVFLEQRQFKRLLDILNTLREYE